MRRRISLVGAAMCVCPLALMAGSSAAASSKSNMGSSAVKRVSCSTRTSIVIPAGQTNVLPPAQQGDEYGTVTCAKLFGSGVQGDRFSVPASGNTVAKYALYFRSGSLHGTYVLTPQPSSLNFLQTNWTGKMKVLGGTGVYKGMKGTGTMTCKTLDGIHITCTDRLKLKHQ